MTNYTLFQKKIEYGIPVELRDQISSPIKHCDYIKRFLEESKDKYDIKERS